MLGYTKRDMDGKAVVIWKAKGFRDMLSLRFSVKASKENDGCFTTPFPYMASGKYASSRSLMIYNCCAIGDIQHCVLMIYKASP